MAFDFKFDIVIATQGDRYKMFTEYCMPSLLTAIININDFINRIVIVPNNLNGRNIKDYEHLKIYNHKIEIIEGDSKYRLMNKYIPYCNKYGYDNYTMHLDDDRKYTEQKFYDFIKAFGFFQNKPIFLDSYRMLKRNHLGIIVIPYHPVFFGITEVSGIFCPNCCMWLAPPKYLKNSKLLDLEWQKKNNIDDDELIILYENYENSKINVEEGKEQPISSMVFLPTRVINDSMENDLMLEEGKWITYNENRSNKLYENEKIFNDIINKVTDNIYIRNTTAIVEDWNQVQLVMFKTFLENSYKCKIDFIYAGSVNTSVLEKIINKNWFLIDF